MRYSTPTVVKYCDARLTITHSSKASTTCHDANNTPGTHTSHGAYEVDE
jgi:hypothetical protein